MDPEQKREVQTMIDEAIKSHNHNGVLTSLVDIRDIDDLFENVLAVVPTKVPTNAWEQIKIYRNGADYRFYWYDFASGAWRYATGT